MYGNSFGLGGSGRFTRWSQRLGLIYLGSRYKKC